ncbi:hypothetical protein HEK616_51010 [Streptomyces nigrescens]|uniref:Uncharacterized protein n=1 Tax=Streptomyces nigrescens TaxID=1920 RepID=A0ABM7ZZ39_STRNI|nr:hypothetical protein HEK616_51010 [Streptomyces nigrescens]
MAGAGPGGRKASDAGHTRRRTKVPNGRDLRPGGPVSGSYGGGAGVRAVRVMGAGRAYGPVRAIGDQQAAGEG